MTNKRFDDADDEEDDDLGPFRFDGLGIFGDADDEEDDDEGPFRFDGLGIFDDADDEEDDDEGPFRFDGLGIKEGRSRMAEVSLSSFDRAFGASVSGEAFDETSGIPLTFLDSEATTFLSCRLEDRSGFVAVSNSGDSGCNQEGGLRETVVSFNLFFATCCALGSSTSGDASNEKSESSPAALLLSSCRKVTSFPLCRSGDFGGDTATGLRANVSFNLFFAACCGFGSSTYGDASSEKSESSPAALQLSS